MHTAQSAYLRLLRGRSLAQALPAVAHSGPFIAYTIMTSLVTPQAATSAGLSCTYRLILTIVADLKD